MKQISFGCRVVAGVLSAFLLVSAVPADTGRNVWAAEDESPAGTELYVPTLTGEITPQGQTLAFGDTVTFEMVVDTAGSGVFSYQWYKDRVLLDGEKSSTLTIVQLAMADAGTYSCEVRSNPSDEDVCLKREFLLKVVKAVPNVSLSVYPESGSRYTNEGITLTAVVSHPANGEVSKPEGTVEFFADGASVGSVQLNDGEAVLSSVALNSDTPHSIYAQYSGDENYEEAASEKISYTVGKIFPEEGTDYIQNSPDGENGWYKSGGALEIIPWDIFDQIREGEAGEWTDKLIKDEETSAEGNEVTFYLQNSETGEISNPKTVSYKLDSTKPNIENVMPLWIDGRDGQREWKQEYCGDIHGGGKTNPDNFLYYVTLTAEDELSGVACFFWKYKNSDEWSEAIPAADGTAEITVNYDQWKTGQGIVVTACDTAGNMSDETVVSAQNMLCVEYDKTGLQRYIDDSGNDVAEEGRDADTRLIYNQETAVSLTAFADSFENSGITVRVNGEPIEVTWTAEDGINTCTFFLSEGESVVEISAEGYVILSNEAYSRIVDKEYVSNIHIIDTTAPTITVTFDSEEYRPDDDRNMIVSIRDKNFRTDELYFSALEVKDIEGNDVSGFDAEEFLDMLKSASWESQDDVYSATVTFSEEAYYSFVLEYRDLANNAAAPYEAEPFLIDKCAPEHLQIFYSAAPAERLSRTGTSEYYNQAVTIRLYADDSFIGVDHFDWTYAQEKTADTDEAAEVRSGRIDCTDTEHFTYNGKTAVAAFTLTADEFTQYCGNFSFTATDKAGHISDVYYDTDHIVVVDTICPRREVIYPEPRMIRAEDTYEIFDGDKALYVNEENTNSVIFYDSTCGDTIPVTLKITEANFYAEDVHVEINGTLYTVDEWSQNGDEWTGTINLANDGEYVITAAYTDRSGNAMPFYQSERIIVDRERPIIAEYGFEPSDTEGRDNTASFIDTLEYGHYFRTGFRLKIYVSDPGFSSEVERIDYRMVSYEGGVMQGETTGTLHAVNGVAELQIPAGFKGQIFAEAYDYAGNRSGEVTPMAFVVDNAAPTIEIVNHNTTAFADAVGNPLYVTDTAVTVTVTDTTSGIREIRYAQNAEKNAIASTSIVLGNTGYGVGDNLGEGWIVAATDRNLVTKVTGTFSYDSDDNNIVLSIDAIDRSGNQSSQVGNAFTVDKTPPVIDVVFRADGNDTDAANLYYRERRIADVTVIERNFDVSGIKAEIENQFGSIPDVTFTEVSDTEHRAVIVFEEGDYTFEISGTDLGNQTAEVSYSGGNENLFFVDTTKPVVTDNFSELYRQETENSFNEDMTVSLSVTEHNFDPDLVKLRIFQKDAGSDHSEAAMTDVTDRFRGGIDWSADGDIHTAVFTCSADAVYRIEITPEDLAGNVSDYESTAIFEIDKTVPVVSAKNGRFVSMDDTASIDVYTYDRRNEPAPTVEFSDLNIDFIQYALTVWIPDYTNPEATPAIAPKKIYLGEDADRTGMIQGGMFSLPDFTSDGVYALELTAVDVAGNESVLNTNTYARLVEQDILAYILNSNAENKSGLYSFQYENGTPVSMRPDSFSDLDIMVFAKEGTDVELVLRDTNAEEMDVNAAVDTDNGIYGLTMYNFSVKADFFKDSFSGDTDADLYLSVKNEDRRIDLGKIHIDNMAPTCDLPKDYNSWHWYFGEETRMITVSNINELLDAANCKVYDNGEEVEFTYSAEDNTMIFALGEGWHSVGIVLRDMAGNVNNIQERTNIYVGYFWLWVITTSSLVTVCLTVFIWLRVRRRRLQWM